MDLIKIGKFIAEKRKNKNLTQIELAQKLNITDRAISKWERGKSMPDSSIMLDLCKILEISVNELLTGEEIEMKDYNKQTELNLIEMVRQKEESDKRLLNMEIVIMIMGLIFYTALVVIACVIKMPIWARFVIIFVGLFVFLAAVLFSVRIEQKTGYYECEKCHHKYVPSFTKTLFAMHVNRTRYMKCPHCGKRSWQKKVLSNDENK